MTSRLSLYGKRGFLKRNEFSYYNSHLNPLSLIIRVEDNMLVFHSFKDLSIVLSFLNNKPDWFVKQWLANFNFNSQWIVYSEIKEAVFVDEERYPPEYLLKYQKSNIEALGSNILINYEKGKLFLQLVEPDINLCKLLNLRGEIKIGNFVIKFGNRNIVNLSSNLSGGEVLGFSNLQFEHKSISSCLCCNNAVTLEQGSHSNVGTYNLGHGNYDHNDFYNLSQIQDLRGNSSCGKKNGCVNMVSSNNQERNLELFSAFKSMVDPNNYGISLTTVNAVAKCFKRKNNGSNGSAKKPNYFEFSINVKGSNYLNAWHYLPGGSSINLGKSGPGSFSLSDPYDNGNVRPDWYNLINTHANADYNYYVPSFFDKNFNVPIIFSNDCFNFQEIVTWVKCGWKKDNKEYAAAQCTYPWP